MKTLLNFLESLNKHPCAYLLKARGLAGDTEVTKRCFCNLLPARPRAIGALLLYNRRKSTHLTCYFQS